ncbi:hypothetical protein ABK040_000903 [Willaertia magna]
MLNSSYRIKTVLNLPLKHLGPTKTVNPSKNAASLIKKSIASHELQLLPNGNNVPSESCLFVPNRNIISSSNTTTIPEVSPITLFTSKNKNVNKIFRHKTILNAQPQVRFYTTNLVLGEEEKVLKRGELPESVKKLIETAPKYGYHGDNINEYLKEGDYDKRQFVYFVANSARFIYSAGVRLAVLKFLYSWSAAADVLAVAKIEVDVSNVPKGKTITVTWRGKPVFIKHRTEEEIKNINSYPLSALKDPQSDAERTKNEDWSVLLAICTHLGCVPVTDAGIMNAFFCPCHGSHYDASGRIVKGPAPLNLEVPKHSFATESLIVLVVDYLRIGGKSYIHHSQQHLINNGCNNKKCYHQCTCCCNIVLKKTIPLDEAEIIPDNEYQTSTTINTSSNYPNNNNYNNKYNNNTLQQSSQQSQHIAQNIRSTQYSTFVSNYYKINENDIKDYLNNKNLIYKIINNEIIIKECPFCHDTKGKISNFWKLYIHSSSGSFYCHRCGCKGSWFDFKSNFNNNNNLITNFSNTTLNNNMESNKNKLLLEKLNIKKQPKENQFKFTKNLQENPEIVNYLEKVRGIKIEIAKQYGVGCNYFTFTKSFEEILDQLNLENNLNIEEYIKDLLSRNLNEDNNNYIKFNEQCLTFPMYKPINDNNTTINSNNKKIEEEDKYCQIVKHKIRSVHDKSCMKLEPAGINQWGLFGWNLIAKQFNLSSQSKSSSKKKSNNNNSNDNDNNTSLTNDAFLSSSSTNNNNNNNINKRIIITEGEFDAMAVYQKTGIPTISLPNGCRSLPIEILPWLEEFDKIYLWMDDDHAGQQGAELFSKKLGIGRCFIVHSNYKDNDINNNTTINKRNKDANEALLNGLDFHKLLEEAAPIRHDRILTFETFKQQIYNEFFDLNSSTNINGIQSHYFPQLNKILKGHRRGELTIITGATGIGKTTVLSQLSIDYCKFGNVPTLWGSFEIKNYRLIKKMICQMAGKDFSSFINNINTINGNVNNINGMELERNQMEMLNTKSVDNNTEMMMEEEVPFMFDAFTSPELLNNNKHEKKESNKLEKKRNETKKNIDSHYNNNKKNNQQQQSVQELLQSVHQLNHYNNNNTTTINGNNQNNLEQLKREFEIASEQFSELPIYFLNFYGSTNIDELLDAMDYAVYVYDVGHIIIDNLQFMFSTSDHSNYLNRFELQDRAIEKFRRFATTRSVHVTLVVHPKKIDEEEQLQISSVFGSAKATQEADNIIMIQRNKLFKYLQIKKNRFDGTLGIVPYKFEKERGGRIVELTTKELELIEKGKLKIEY